MFDAHKVCFPLSKEDDTVYIAASNPDENGEVWWMTYRQIMVKPAHEFQIEVARIKPSRSSGMLGTTIENVPRFDLDYLPDTKILSRVLFDEQTIINVFNPRRIYDYTEPE